MPVQLPNEIWMEIIRHILDYDLQNLYSLNRVFFYHVMDLRYGGWWKPWYVSLDPRDEVIMQLKRLIKLRDPGVSSRVRRLSLYNTNVCHGWAERTINYRKLQHIYPPQKRSFLDAVIPRFLCRTGLDQSLSSMYQDTIRRLHDLPHLEHLDVTLKELSKDLLPYYSPRLTILRQLLASHALQLKSLTLSGHPRALEPLLRCAAFTNFPCIEVLDISFVNNRRGEGSGLETVDVSAITAELIHSTSSSLQYLVLYFGEEQPKGTLLGLFPKLATLPHLHTLRVGGYLYPLLSSTPESLGRFIHRQANSLRTLHLNLDDPTIAQLSELPSLWAGYLPQNLPQLQSSWISCPDQSVPVASVGSMYTSYGGALELWSQSINLRESRSLLDR